MVNMVGCGIVQDVYCQGPAGAHDVLSVLTGLASLRMLAASRKALPVALEAGAVLKGFY